MPTQQAQWTIGDEILSSYTAWELVSPILQLETTGEWDTPTWARRLKTAYGWPALDPSACIAQVYRHLALRNLVMPGSGELRDCIQWGTWAPTGGNATGKLRK